MKKKIALVLAVVFLVCLLPVTAMANEGEGGYIPMAQIYEWGVEQQGGLDSTVYLFWFTSNVSSTDAVTSVKLGVDGYAPVTVVEPVEELDDARPNQRYGIIFDLQDYFGGKLFDKYILSFSIPGEDAELEFALDAPSWTLTINGGNYLYDGAEKQASYTTNLDDLGYMVGGAVFLYNGLPGAPVDVGVYAVALDTSASSFTITKDGVDMTEKFQPQPNVVAGTLTITQNTTPSELAVAASHAPVECGSEPPASAEYDVTFDPALDEGLAELIRQELALSTTYTNTSVPGEYSINVAAWEGYGYKVEAGQVGTLVAQDTTAPTMTHFGFNHIQNADSYPYVFVTAKGLTDFSGIARVEFEVWSDKNGDDDVRIYATDKTGVWIVRKDTAGSYLIGLDPANHKEDIGRYHIKVRAWDTIGNDALIGTTTVTIPSHFEYNPGQTTQARSIAIAIKGLTDSDGVNKVEFAVWSENNGQDDLVWYSTAKAGALRVMHDGRGSYFIAFNTANHKNDIGKYHVHVYFTDNNGGKHLFKTTEITILADSTPPTMSRFEYAPGQTASSSIIHVAAKDVKDINGISKVEFAVWSANGGQDDLKWYTPLSEGNGSYSWGINRANHKNDKGVYNVHIYATDRLGNRGCIGTTTITFT